MVVNIRLFGSLKKFGDSAMLVIDLPSQCCVSELKERVKGLLRKNFPDTFHDALVDRAAVASNTRVLSNEETINGTKALALLPPVCGG